MQPKKLSLVHQVRSPTTKIEQKPPLLLMLHGFLSNEEKLMSFAHMIDSRFHVVSVRGPISLTHNAYAWFPIKLAKSENNFLLKDVENCRSLLTNFIGELIEAYELNYKQIYLMGFSQGAVMSYSLALTIPQRFSGIVAMNGRISKTILNQMYEQNLVNSQGIEGLPVLATHGVNDSVIPLVHGQATRDRLNELKVKLDYREYPIGHKVHSMVIADSNAWLSSHLNRSLKSAISIEQEKLQTSM